MPLSQAQTKVRKISGVIDATHCGVIQRIRRVGHRPPSNESPSMPPAGCWLMSIIFGGFSAWLVYQFAETHGSVPAGLIQHDLSSLPVVIWKKKQVIETT